MSMLGVLFRGVFILSIIVWYSSSVWKLIDGYFKDQFRSYLEEEYRKNPKMRQDVQRQQQQPADAAAGNTGSPVSVATPASPEPPREPREPCSAAAEAECPVEPVGSVGGGLGDADDQRGKPAAGGGTGENEVDAEPPRGSTDKNAFRETAKSPLESRSDTLEREESSEHRPDIDQPPGKRKSEVAEDEEEKEEEEEEEEEENDSPARRTGGTTATSSASAGQHLGKQARRSLFPASTGGGSPPKPKRPATSGKRKVKTIVLSEADFGTAKGGRVADDDFWEFEEDAEEREQPRGILVADLPYKPRADIGDLERVTEDEYCPLTPDDEHSCGEAVAWP